MALPATGSLPSPPPQGRQHVLLPLPLLLLSYLLYLLLPMPARCADICSSEQAGMSFLSWQWTGGVEERCDCFTSSSKSCLAIAGPPAPPLDYCMGGSTPGTTGSTGTTGTSAGTTGATPGTTGTTATFTSSLPATTSTPSQHMVVITGGNDGSSWNNGAHEEVEVGSLPPKHHRFKFGI